MDCASAPGGRLAAFAQLNRPLNTLVQEFILLYKTWLTKQDASVDPSACLATDDGDRGFIVSGMNSTTHVYHFLISA